MRSLDTYLTSGVPPNFFSVLVLPEMISMTKGISLGGAGGAATRTGTGATRGARGGDARRAGARRCVGWIRRSSIVEEALEGGSGRLGDLVVQGIPQDELNAGLAGGQAELLGLSWGDQHIDDLHHDGFAFGVFFEILAGGEYFDILQQGLRESAQIAAASGRVAGDQDVDVHARHDEAGDAHHFIDADGHGAHSRWYHGGHSTAGALGSEARFDDGLLGEDGGDDAAAEDVFDLCSGSRRDGARPVGDLDVAFFQYSADFEILGGERQLRQRGTCRGSGRPVDQHAIQHQAGAGRHQKRESQNAYESFIHLDPRFARLDLPAPVAGKHWLTVLFRNNCAKRSLTVAAAIHLQSRDRKGAVCAAVCRYFPSWCSQGMPATTARVPA